MQLSLRDEPSVPLDEAANGFEHFRLEGDLSIAAGEPVLLEVECEIAESIRPRSCTHHETGLARHLVHAELLRIDSNNPGVPPANARTRHRFGSTGKSATRAIRVSRDREEIADSVVLINGGIAPLSDGSRQSAQFVVDMADGRLCADSPATATSNATEIAFRFGHFSVRYRTETEACESPAQVRAMRESEADGLVASLMPANSSGRRLHPALATM